MQQFEFKDHIAKVYLQRYGSPPKRAGLSRSSYLQGQRKRNIEDKCFDGINKGDTLENKRRRYADHKRRRFAGKLCSKRPFTQCSKCNIKLCVGYKLSYHTL